MKISQRFQYGWALALISLSPPLLQADTMEETIAKARAYLGTEEALDGIKTLHYVGVMTANTGKEGAVKQIPVEIVLQKPYRQKITAIYPDKIETNALDDYEGWVRLEDPADRNKWRMNLFSKDKVMRFRVNTWEMLSFYKGTERGGGKVEDRGPATIEGRPAHCLAYTYDRGFYFLRYFDLETGRLLLTKTEDGSTIREEGEIVVEGIRFPKTTIKTSVSPQGETRSVSITFDSIKINEKFGDDYFAFPTSSGGLSRGVPR